MVRVALPRLRRSWVSASVSTAASGNDSVAAQVAGARGRCPGNVVMRAPPLDSVVARISARCTVRTPVRDPAQSAADVHQARRVARAAHLGPVLRTLPILSASMAVEVSEFFRANVPPNPQQVSAAGSSTSVIPRTARSSCSGLSPTRSIRSEWQVGW